MADIKEIMNHGKSEFGIPGYTVAKTHHYITKSAIISPEKSSKSSKAKDPLPDPTKYSPTVQQLQQTFWKTPNGKFYISKKSSFVDEQIKRSKSTPGPGSYNKETEKMSKRILNGIFNKGERLNFLTTVESYAEETPCSWKYSCPAYKIPKSTKWITPKVKSKPEKEEVGPGKYSEGVEKAMSKIMTTNPKYSFPKSKSPKPGKVVAPGVGSYKDVETGFFKHVAKRSRMPVIAPYKLKSYTDLIIKQAKKTPGPGAYNIIPELKK